MAVEFGDHASGFRHNEVIKFINNEVLMNGGGPDFYVAFRSRPWNEVEDRLLTVVADPRVPRDLKRACTWSALALSVRLGARQREQQSRRLRRLKEQVEEREAASRALASELQHLREERQAVLVQLHNTTATLQHVVDECLALRGQLLQIPSVTQTIPPPQVVMPNPGADNQMGTVWSVGEEEQDKEMAMGACAMVSAETQMGAPMAFIPGPQSTWVPVVQPPMPMPMPFPMQIPMPPPLPQPTTYPMAPCPLGFPYSAPIAPEMGESEAAATVVAKPPMSGRNMQAKAKAKENTDHKEDKNPQETSLVEEKGNQSEGENLVNPQGAASLSDVEKHRQEDQKTPQKTDTLGDSSSQSQKESPVKPKDMCPLEKTESSNQEESSGKPQETSLLEAISCLSIRKDPKKQDESQKTKQPKEKKDSELQQQEKSASGYRPMNWVCPLCKAINFSWRTTCYKCKKFTKTVENEDPGL